MSRLSTTATVFALALLASAAAGAQATDASQTAIYGSQIMTQRERLEYGERMRNATSKAEQERVRAEHHKRMQTRAQQLGKTLSEEPPAPGMGAGKGMGPGQGRGPGGAGRGMGPGGGGGGPGK